MSRRLRQFVIGASVAVFALAMVPSEALAQRGRAPAPAGSRQAVARPPAHRPSHYPAYRSYYRPYYGYGYGYRYRPYYPYYRYYPYYYSPFYWGVGFGWGYGWYGAYGYPWYAYPPPYYGAHYDYDEASARIEVTPRDAQVFVDGYYVGSVDDFDGVFQRLHVRSGEHSLEIYKEGYRTIRERVNFVRGETYRVRFTMEPLAAGESAPPRPAPEPGATTPARDEPSDRIRTVPAPSRGAVRGEGGALAIRVQPEGATVLVDGERWDAHDAREPLVIQLEEGTHQIEVQKEGYRPYTAEIRVRRGETVPLNINLRREGN